MSVMEMRYLMRDAFSKNTKRVVCFIIRGAADSNFFYFCIPILKIPIVAPPLGRGY